MSEQVSIYPTGQNALTITLGNAIDPTVNNYVFRLYQQLQRHPNPFWKDLIPAYSTLTIIYDVVSIRKYHPSAFTWVQNEIEQALHECEEREPLPSRKVNIPVCYDPAFGFDLKSVAKTNKLTVDEVITLHTQQIYQIYMLGFLPGFAYMGIVNDKIATPRLSTPRKHVPAGSVGIAGNQTGIYPLDSPGGWNIIGRTPVTLFDPDGEALTLLQPGDEVTFMPISKEAYETFDADKFQLVQP